MTDIRFWALRASAWALMVVTIYVAVVFAESRSWPRYPLVVAAIIAYCLIDRTITQLRSRSQGR